MQGLNCPSCGAPNVPDARFCAYCGSALPRAPSPLPSSVGAAMPPALEFPVPYGQPPPPPPRRRSRLLVVIVIVVVVFLVIGAISFVFLMPAAPAIQVGQMDIWAPDHVCDLNSTNLSTPYYYTGFNGSTGENQSFDLFVPNFNATACTVHHVTTNTTGFEVTYVQVPLGIPAGVNATASMNISIVSPGSPFSGNINLVFS